MPTYEYICEACDHEFEEFQSIKAKPIRTCPECGKKRVKRLIGCGAGLIFKGSGFYETDYRSEGYQKAAKAEKEKSSPGKSKKESSKSGGSEKKATPGKASEK